MSEHKVNFPDYFRATVLHSTNALYSLASEKPEAYLKFAQKIIGAKAESAIRKFNEADSLERKIEIFENKVSKYMRLGDELAKVDICHRSKFNN